MKALIVEDEKLSAERLENLLKKEHKSISVERTTHSAEETEDYLKTLPDLDLIFMDIELGDGTAFDVLENVEVSTPIIFTTAYDAYAIKAFKFNSVDYLLKPIDSSELKTALEKWELSRDSIDSKPIIEDLKHFFKGNFKKRFLVKKGDKFLTVPIEEVLYFFSEDSYTFLLDKEGKKWIVDYSLEDLVEVLDPTLFFRLNRKLLSHIDAIKNVSSYFNGRLQVHLEPEYSDQIVISREKVKPFKAWLDG